MNRNKRLLSPAPAFLCRGCQRPTRRWQPRGRRCLTCTPAAPLCDRLRHARHQAGLPLDDAARRADVEPRVLGIAETRPGHYLQREELCALAQVYGIKAGRFGVKGGAR